jgi:hypothetical protein
MKRLLLLASSSLLFTMPVMAMEVNSRITDSVQLTVQGTAIDTNRIGSSYSVSGTNISVTALGGLTGGTATAAQTISAGDYDIGTDESAFSFSESSLIGDTPITSQTVATGTIASPALYSDTLTQTAGVAGTLAGTVSLTAAPTVTAGGAGTTGIAQRTLELSVFR